MGDYGLAKRMSDKISSRRKFKLARFEVWLGKGGWYARFVAKNGREVWRTSEGYKRKAGALKAVACLKSPVWVDEVPPVGKKSRKSG